LHELRLPPANPRGKPDPAILEFSNVPRRGWIKTANIELTFYDIAGEVFANDEMAKQYAPFLADADDIIFLFDPTESNFSALRAARLIDLVSRVALKNKRKNIIVTLSKMDELRTQDGWADIIGNLWPDVPPATVDLPIYFQQMEHLSEMLRLWWSDPVREAQNLMNSLGENVRFAAVSSIGHQPLWDCGNCAAENIAAHSRCISCQTGRTNARLRLAKRPEPFRVRDPLFWIFKDAGVM
ncbi:MAG TPA: GTPase domain-containing protein, partial [Blastocatellia bacterium]|nr:GTPase domain-containing protein [Blastocatellia bacterium]